jgi:hypothetical protein
LDGDAVPPYGAVEQIDGIVGEASESMKDVWAHAPSRRPPFSR